MKTVALVGMSTRHRDQAPWDNKDIEIWTLNESQADRFNYVKRCDRHFQLHPDWNFMREGNQNDPQHPEWLKREHDFPIYTQEVFDFIPSSKQYPLDEITEWVSNRITGLDISHWKYFTSTFPYMLLLALYEGFERIEVYGFDMGSETEYAYQRGSASWWLGFAIGLGIDVYIPDNCNLLGENYQMYGYEQVVDINLMAIEILRNRYSIEEEKRRVEMSQIEGGQKELRAQLDDLQKEFMGREEVIKKGKYDEKVKVRKIEKLRKEFDEKGKPLAERFNKYEQEKLGRVWPEANSFAGAHAACAAILKQAQTKQPVEFMPRLLPLARKE